MCLWIFLWESAVGGGRIRLLWVAGSGEPCRLEDEIVATQEASVVGSGDDSLDEWRDHAACSSNGDGAGRAGRRA